MKLHRQDCNVNKAMRILITNDDGINAPGLAVMQDIANQLAESREVWTVAPATEQSGTGHCVSFTKPFQIVRIDDRKFCVDGTPADCVLAAIHEVMKQEPPDLVLSGVNSGNNAGENVLYSGTVGAALEAALQGFKAIALSQYFGLENRYLPNPFEGASSFAARLIKSILCHDRWGDYPYKLFYNVNFPPCSAEKVAGTRVVRQGFRSNSRFGVVPQASPSGRKYLWLSNGSQSEPNVEIGTDVHANMANFIAVTPMNADMTSHDAVAELSAKIK